MENALDYLERLAVSRLLSDTAVSELRADAALTSLTPKELASELVRRKLISKYQSRVILRSANAKFDYGAYRVVGRHTDGFRTGLFQAVHRTNGKRVEFDRVSGLSDDSVLAKARHPNLVGCLEVFAEGEYSIVVFEPVVGSSLADKIERGSLSVDAASEAAASGIVRQVAEACWELHSHGLSHGMICPAAVVVDEAGDAKLLWRPGRTIDDDDAIGERLRSVAAVFSEGTFSESVGQSPGVEQSPSSEFGADVYSLGQVLSKLAGLSGSVTSHVANVIEGATGGRGRFAHAGVVAALLVDVLGEAVADVVGRGVVLRQDSQVEGEVAGEAEVAADGFLPANSSDSPAVVGPLGLSTSGGSRADRLRERRQPTRRTQLVWGGIAAVLAVGGGWLIAREFTSESAVAPVTVGPSENRTIQDGTDSDSSGDVSDVIDGTTSEQLDGDGMASAAEGKFAVGPADDGESLWLSPTSGGPIDLGSLPPSSQMYICMRPSAILSNPQALRALESLGPDLRSKRKNWETLIGVHWEDLDVLAAAVVPRDALPLEVCWLLQPNAHWEMPANWKRGRSSEILDQTIVQLGDRVVWDSGNGFVIGSEAVVRQAIESRKAASLLRRELEQLRLTTDKQHLLTTLLVPRFVSTEGRKLTTAQTRPLLDAIFDSMGDETRACALGLHINEDQFFGELRFVAGGNGGAVRSSQDLRERIHRIPLETESAIAALPSLDGYWRRLALRSVRMMQFAEENIRVASDRRTVVSNVSLPPAAAHNLFMAIELVTASAHSAPGIVAGGTTAASPVMTVQDVLQKRMSIDIPQQSIEFALRDIAVQINAEVDASNQIEIEIDGPALQADGITRNQQIRGYRKNDATFAEILTGLVMKANPVTTVQSPTEPNQKLVWVRLSEPSGSGRRIILITTRTAATEKSYSLPSEFRQK